MEPANLTSPSPHTLVFLEKLQSEDLNNFAEMQKQGQAKSPLPRSKTQCLPKLDLAGEKRRGSEDPLPTNRPT